MDPLPSNRWFRGLGVRPSGLGFRGWGFWVQHRVIVTIKDKEDYIRVLLFSYYTTITGWRGVLLRHKANDMRDFSKQGYT